MQVLEKFLDNILLIFWGLPIFIHFLFRAGIARLLAFGHHDLAKRLKICN